MKDPCKTHFIQDDATMGIKLIIIASLVAIASSDLGKPAASNVYVVLPTPALSATFVPADAAPKTDSKPEETVKEDTDPALIAAYDNHKVFMEKNYITPPYHYSYGYECFDWQTGLNRSRYESRYGDVAMGTYIIRASDGNRTIVDYTIDTPTGFYGVLRKDFQVPSKTLGYARLAGPLAYASHPSLEDYASSTTILADPAANDSPLVKSAYRIHGVVINYLALSAPFNMNWGYEVIDSHTGIRRSQYESYRGSVGEGSYTEIAADGTQSRIDYRASPEGFAVTSLKTVARQS